MKKFADLKMNGPYKIWKMNAEGKQVKNTGNYVSNDIKFGNYAFGRIIDGVEYTLYIGRCSNRVETGLLAEINQQIDNGKADGCDLFFYSIAGSKTEAYEKECQNYHDFMPARNKVHPAKPKDNGHYKCPVAGCDYHN